MVGIRINQEFIDKISDILTLEDENALRVYLALLNLGSGTLGQISSIVGFDYITTSSILEDLNLQGLVKKIGNVSRYYCLEPFLDGILTSINKEATNTVIDLLNKRIERASLSPIDNQKMFEEYIRNTLKSRSTELLSSFSGSEEAKKEVEQFLETSLTAVSKTAMDLIKDSENNSKKLLKDFLNKDFQSLFQIVDEITEKIRLVYEYSRNIDTKDLELPADILFGESSVLAMMKDLVLRAKSNLTILMPKPELQSIMLVSEKIISKRVKVIITGDLEKVPRTMLKRLSADTALGTCQLRQSNEITSWAVIKDNEEIVFAPDVKTDEMMVGIWIQASIHGLEQLIQQFSLLIRSMESKAQNIRI